MTPLEVAETHNIYLKPPEKGVCVCDTQSQASVGEVVYAYGDMVWVRDILDEPALTVPYPAKRVYRDLSTTEGRLSFIRQVLKDCPPNTSLGMHCTSAAEDFLSVVAEQLGHVVDAYHRAHPNSIESFTMLDLAMSWQLVLSQQAGVVPCELCDDVWKDVCEMLWAADLISATPPQPRRASYMRPRE
tara:strand:- start:10093 stop:10653 length:561 start_codon:yes stop_codon:yes gene_type:complete